LGNRFFHVQTEWRIHLEKYRFEEYVKGMKRFTGKALLTATAMALLTLTCKAPDLFSEYDGQSILSTTSLQDDNWQLMPDYSFEAGTTADDYMDYSKVSSNGGPNAGPVYRLEIKNLLKNGDFETGTTAPWTTYNISTGTVSIINSAPDPVIDNNTVQFKMGAEEWTYIKMSNAFNSGGTYIPSKSYFFKYDYRTFSPVNFFFVPQWDTVSVDPQLGDYRLYTSYGGANGSSDSPSETNRNTYPPLDPTVVYTKILNIFTASATGTDDTLALTGFNQNGYFDNFRIVRSPEGNFDLKLRLKMNINHRPDIDIIPGYYKFSVWVKQEDVSSRANVFQADRVELGIQAYDAVNNKNVSDYKVFYQTQPLSDLYSQEPGGGFSGDWSSGWVQLVLASQFTFQVPDISADPVMELTISPSNPGIKDKSWNRLTAGSILISEPVLEYSSIPW